MKKIIDFIITQFILNFAVFFPLIVIGIIIFIMSLFLK